MTSFSVWGVVLFGLGLFGAGPVAATPQTFVCSEAADHVATQPDIQALAEKAYGPLQYRAWSQSAPCVVPTAILAYKTQTVLISTAEPPFQAHACPATLTAHVFRRAGADLKLARVVKDFAKTGDECVAGRFKPVTLAGRDGFSIEGAGGGQGVRAGWLEFYQFDGPGIRQIKLPGLSCIWIDYRQAGPAGADMQSIDATWRLGGANNSRLFLDFHISKASGKASTLKTQWDLGRNGFKMVRGSVPEAFAGGACL